MGFGVARIVQRLLAAVLAISMVVSGTVGVYAASAHGLHQSLLRSNSYVNVVRFVSPDPMDPTVPTVGTNRYSYSGNDPINRSDQNGLCPMCIGVVIGAATAYFSGTTEANTPTTPDDVTQTSETMAMANMAIGAIPGKVVDGFAKAAIDQFAARSGVWAERAVIRGFMIEEKLGANLSRNFRTIDSWEKSTGTARSIKSVNLGDKTYQDPSKLASKLRSYLNDVANFKGATGMTRDGKPLSISRSDIKRRVLEVVVPNKPSSAQQAAIDSVKAAGKTSGVDVKTTVYP